MSRDFQNFLRDFRRATGARYNVGNSSRNMGKDEEKNMFDVENKTELEGAGGAYERPATQSW